MLRNCSSRQREKKREKERDTIKHIKCFFD